MNKTSIKWARNPDGSQGYTWNPITGCLNHDNGLCKGGGFPCYAYKLANGRLKSRYLEQRQIGNRIDGSEWPWQEEPSNEYLAAFNDPFYPRFWEERLLELPNDVMAGKERGIFICDMGDLFGVGVPESWTRQIIERIKGWPEFRFYLLTKQPQNLIKFSPFPENCWVGVTVTSDSMMQPAYEALDCITAKVKYISLEPYLSPLGEANIKLLAGAEYYKWLDWLIIGACTGTKTELLEACQRWNINGANTASNLSLMPWGKKWTLQPPIEWVKQIIEAADKAGIKVFLKDNLKPLLVQNKGSAEYAPLWANGGYGTLKQEMPK